MDFTCIHYKNETNDISMNDDGNFPTNIMHYFNCQIPMKMNLQEQNTIRKKSEFLTMQM